MSEWIDMIGYFLGGAMMLVMLMSLLITIIIPGIDRWSKRFFIVLFSCLTICITVYIVDLIIYKDPEMAVAERIVCLLECLFISFLIPIPTVFLLHNCGESYRTSKLLRTVIILWGVYLILTITAQFTDWSYTITPDNRLVIGAGFGLMISPMVVILILNLIAVFRRKQKLSKRYFTAILIYLIPMTVAAILHGLFYLPMLLDIALILCAFSMFGIVLSDQIDQYFRQQREIAHQHASIMVLQMRPHFIYNTMMSIYYLCEQDPKKAQQVTLDFNTYLRKNFTAIASENTIPFTEELEHTRAYLAVEQAQFEDMLYVSYDTPSTAFRVPPLTLQPIVENAVKHGMDPDAEPLSIVIRTLRTEAGDEIIVENSGADFVPADDKEPHIALANIRLRLKMMCGGEMSITPRDGGGTVVRVKIPEQ